MNSITSTNYIFPAQLEKYSTESLLMGEPIILENIQNFLLGYAGVVRRMERDNIRFKPSSKTSLDFLGIKFIYGCTRHLIKSLSDKKINTLAASATSIGLQYAESFKYVVLPPVIKPKDGEEIAPAITNPRLLAIQSHYAEIKEILNKHVWNLSVEDRVQMATLRAVIHFLDCVIATDYVHAGADALHCIMHVGKAYAYMGAEKSGFVVDQKAYEKACFKMAKVLADEMRGKHVRI